ncbi:MAG: hypothetical protein R2857_14710 [Vampirovibrionales bacterium]
MAFLESLRGHDWLKTATPTTCRLSGHGWTPCLGSYRPSRRWTWPWDLQGKVLGQPVWRLWNETLGSQPFESAYTIGIDSLDEMQRKTELALGRGYTILKLKLGATRWRDQAILTSVSTSASLPTCLSG